MNGDAASNPLNKEARMSYIDDHPTHFNWEPFVAGEVQRLQGMFPWLTYICTYEDHPPAPIVNGTRLWPYAFYDAVSYDVWGGGKNPITGRYNGYRGKPLRPKLGKKIFREIFYGNGPEIDWCIYRGRMWWNPATGGNGWQLAPPGPSDSDSEHRKHIHVSLRRR
jgi:hypothetical protein